MRAVLIVVLFVHGSIHLMGFAKAFGFMELRQLSTPISRPQGLAWLAAGLLTLVCVFVPPRAFWILGTLAAALSQVLIAYAWQDAKFGTIANIILLLAAAYAFVSAGPLSFAHAYATDTATELGRSQLRTDLVTEDDLKHVPPPVQRYLRVTGSVGQPRVSNFRARWRGRIRESAQGEWMAFEAEQVNSIYPLPARLFFMQAIMKGLPVDVYHRFVGPAATFGARILSAFQIISAAGPDMNRSETVTILNDLCLLAPSALLDPSMHWESSTEDSAQLRFERGSESVHVELRFNAAGELTDFISDDRSKASADGKSFERLRWSTPVSAYQKLAGRHIFDHGESLWHAKEGKFAYGEFKLIGIEYNVAH
jgi:hypothetical protein